MQRIINKVAIVLSIVICLVVVVLSLKPVNAKIDFIPYEDKGAHFIAYGAFCFCLSLCFFKETEPSKFVKANVLGWIMAFVSCVIVGSLIEVLQPMFNRSKEALDVLSDALGALGGIFLVAIFELIVLKCVKKNKK